MKTSVKSALVRHSGAVAVALLAFSFSFGGSHVVRAQDPEVSSLSELVFAPILKAVEGIEQRLSNVEATLGLFAASFNSEHLVTRQICIADESGAQTCITKAQLDSVLASMTHAELPKPSPVAVAIAETPVAEPTTEAAAEPAGEAIAEPASETAAAPAADPAAAPAAEPTLEPTAEHATAPTEPTAERVETAAVEEPAPATITNTTTDEIVENNAESQNLEQTGSLPEPGAALIWHPEVETSIP